MSKLPDRVWIYKHKVFGEQHLFSKPEFLGIQEAQEYVAIPEEIRLTMRRSLVMAAAVFGDSGTEEEEQASRDIHEALVWLDEREKV